MPNTDKDTRIVEMQFDAKDFDKGIRQSQKTLNDFKKDLNFEDASKQMESFNKEGNNLMTMFSSMSQDIHKLTNEFAGIGSISTHIAKEIKGAWEGALRSVKQFAKSLTSDQVNAGMDKFNDLQQSVQTIKSATGDAEEHVYKVLRRLNEYTDMTSYSFSDMAANIGKFTSVGIPLEQAEKQMEGIANWAARSGGDIQEASRAMYNLSQAMGVGALTRIDWKSIENAGMATKEFKNQLIQAGLAVGTLVKKGDKIFTASKFGSQVEVTYQNMSETLSKRWADTETMQKAFMAYYYEDLYYEGKIASAIETSRDQRDEIRAYLNSQTSKDVKMDYDEWMKLEGEWADKWREDGKDVEESREAARKALLDAAVEQKKLVKETNAEGYEVYKTIAKNGKQIEITTDNLEEFFSKGLMDESLVTVTFNLDADPLIEMTEKQRKALTDALGEDNVILKKDWIETMDAAGIATEEVMKASMDAAVKAGTLVREENKKTGEVTYKTAKKLGKQMVVTTENFTDTLGMKWFNEEVADTVGKFTDIAKASYEAAQRCTNFKQVISALKDMLSTGWMNTYNHIFGELSESMGLFTAICNKASEILEKFVSLRNGILEKWGANGGRNSLWGALVGESDGLEGDTLFAGAYGLLDAMKDISDAIYEAFWDFVGRFISDDNKAIFDKDREGVGMEFLALKLQQITENLRDFTTKIKDFLFTADAGETETRFDRIKHVVEAVFSTITLVVQIVKGIGTFVGEILKQLYPAFHAIELLVDYLLQLFTGSVVKGAKENTIGNFFKNLAERLKPITTLVNAVIVTLVKVIAYVIDFVQKSGLAKAALTVAQIALSHVMKAVAAFIQSGIPQKITDFIASVIQKIPALIAKVKSLYSTLMNSKFMKTLKTNLKNAINWGRNLIAGFTQGAQDGGSSFLDKILEPFKQIWEAIKNFFGIHSPSTTAAEAGENVMQGFVQGIQNGEGGIIGQITGVFTGIWDKIKSVFTNGIDSIKEKLANWGPTLKSFFEGTNFKSLMDTVKEVLKWTSMFRMGSGLVSFGKGIKGIGKGIKVFGKNLKNLNLSNIFSNMFNISNIINSNNDDHRINKTFNFGNLGPALLEIAAAIGILVLAAKELIAMKPEDLKQAGISIGILLTGLVTASVLAKKFGGNGGSLLGLAAALWLIILPMKSLMAIPWTDGKGIGGGLLEMLGKLTIVLGILVIAAKIAGNVKIKGLLSMAIAINLLMGPLKTLSKMSLFANEKDSTSLVQGMIALLGLMTVMGVSARIAGKGAKGILAMAVALNLLIIPVKTFGGMKTDQLAVGLGSLAGIMLGIGMLAYSVDDKAVGKLAGLVGAITALTAVGWLIGHTLNWKQALIGFTPILLLLGAMIGMFALTSKMSTEQLEKVKNIFTAFSVTVGVIAISIVAIGALGIPLATIIAFFAGIILVITMIGVMVKLAAKTNTKSISNLSFVLLAFCGVIAAVTGALIFIAKNNVDWTLIAAFTAGLVGLIGGIAFLLPIIGKLDPMTAAKGILIIAVAVVAIMGAISLMIPVLLGSVGNSLEKLSVKLSMASGLFKDFFDGIGSITEESVKHAGTVMDSIKDIILKFVGFGDHSEDIQSVLTQLEDLGLGLDLFFLNDAKLPDPESAMSFKILNKFIEMGPSLAGFNVGDLPQQILYLGVGLGLFNRATSEITTDEPLALGLMKGIFGQADNIEKFSKLPLTQFAGDMSTLGGAMSLYAKGANEVTGIEADTDAPDIEQAIGILKSVTGALSGEDGKGKFEIPPDLPDETALGVFAAQLGALGLAMSSFSEGAKGMDSSGTQKALEAVTLLATLGGYLTVENLAVTGVFDSANIHAGEGAGTLGQFALDIGALGTALSEFSALTSNAVFDQGLGALEHFQELNQKLTADNLAFATAFNDANIHKSVLETFGEDIGHLGRALASFAKNVTMDDGTQADFDHAVKALNFMTTMSHRLDKIKVGNNLYTLIHGEGYNLNMMADDMDLLGQGLNKMSDAVSGAGENGKKFDYESVTQSLDAISKLISIIYQTNDAVNSAAGVEWDVSDFIYDINRIMDSMMSIPIGSSDIKSAPIYRIAILAKELTNAFSEVGVVDLSVLAGFANIASGLHDLMTIDPSLDFEYPGEMIAAGIETGIKNGESKVIQAAIDVVQAAIDAANDTADVGSPSKVFAEMGGFLDAGLVKGMLGSKDDVEGASSDMATAAIEQAGLIMAAVSQALADNVDLQPTITPVLDLSNLTAAGATLDTIFDGYALNLAGALNRAIAATSSTGPAEVIVQNPTDLTTVESAMTTLQTEIANLHTAISNIRIVLNNGAVAGGVVDDIDLMLGRRGMYDARRN